VNHGQAEDANIFVFVDQGWPPALYPVKVKLKAQVILKELQVIQHQFFQSLRSVYMQGLFPAQQPERGKQAENAKDMIPVEVADEYVMDLPQAYPVFAKLHLGSFPAIDQKKPLIHIQQMSGGKSF
jgi:hypothetical protein